MAADKAESYWLAIDVLEARETILNMRISAYPHMKKSSAQKFEREMQRMAFPKLKSEGPALSIREAAQRLGRILSG